MSFIRRMQTTAAAAAVTGLLMTAAPQANAADQDPDTPGYQFTASAEHRAELLKQVQAENKKREAAHADKSNPSLVENGKAVGVIVLSKDASGGDKQAAELLQSWLELISGAKLPIEQSAGNKPAILVGKAATDAGLDLSKIKSVTDEGIRIQVKGNKAMVAGQDTGASIRAAGRFLEEQYGARYLTDLDWGRHYPEMKTVRLIPMDISEKPTFNYRRIWGPEGAFRNNTWNYWNGHGGSAPPVNHSWGGVLSKDDFKKHPEWFRLDEEGKRVNGHWYNLGNPEVRKRFKAWVMSASQDGTRDLSLSPPDDHRVDYSPEAKKYDEPVEVDPSSGRVSMTNRFMGIVNEAAEEVYKKNKKARFGFYAYSDYTLPPTNPELQELSPNIQIWIAPIRFSRYHPLGHPNSTSRQLLKEIVDGWSEVANSIGYRTYNYNLAEVMTPYSKITTWSHDFPYLAEHKAEGVNLESMNTWELYAPHLYLSIRLGYDPTLDPWMIMADYYDKAYGPAAEPMQEYWMNIDEAFVNLKTESGSYHALPHVYTPERLAKLDSLIKQAESAVASGGTENQKYRVNVAKRGLTRAHYWRDWFDYINEGKVAEAKKNVDEWVEFVVETQKMGHSNKYATTYLRRFIGGNTARAFNAVYPENGKPGQVLMVLPNEWKFKTGEHLEKDGFKGNPADPKLDDSKWPTVKTYTTTLDEQGYPEYFGPMWYRTTITGPKNNGNLSLHFVKADRKVTVFIDGKQIGDEANEAFKGTTIDIGDAIKPGQEHQVTVRVDHIPLPELFLGGLVHPVYLIQNAQ